MNEKELSLFELYIKSLEIQISNKKFFIDQANKAISNLPKQPSSNPSTSKDKGILDKKFKKNLEELLSKPIFLPERSDPIGISLASNSLNHKIKSSACLITDLQNSIDLNSNLIEYHTSTNKLLIEIIEIIKNYDIKNKPILSSIKSQYKHLQDELKEYITTFLLTEPYNNDDIMTIVKVIDRLISYDMTLTVDDFKPFAMQVFKILFEYNFVILEEKNSSGKKYVKLLDFSDNI
ncbi:hypothetical protein TBLA_0B09650 [Henningerozyma blattae CBS 6284]|uniref:Uncharacterized protein n=1 Tax=Henningerozyma blattae (strain ATCC 34711 / CBS 6284 / DSM 70876 / NBRC 10599 / NRRL Y-10934 / UCD 77-7) TaxID=1071380 RepID=I2H080_HENB6|nr:hypothetical protein TBLA_0B09650 [Tetrapisispora blattae CBS 6284]CCH59782.1 hypothetical protein TBLA_0B09650 [Tetrapisispora blattae CBS 6284]